MLRDQKCTILRCPDFGDWIVHKHGIWTAKVSCLLRSPYFKESKSEGFTVRDEADLDDNEGRCNDCKQYIDSHQ